MQCPPHGDYCVDAARESFQPGSDSLKVWMLIIHDAAFRVVTWREIAGTTTEHSKMKNFLKGL
jgi:hypothetical protein